MELVNFEIKTRQGEYEKNTEPTPLMIIDVQTLNKIQI